MGNESSDVMTETDRHTLCTPRFKEKLDFAFSKLDQDGNGQLEK